MNTNLIPPVESITMHKERVNIESYYLTGIFANSIPVAKEILEESFRLQGQKPIIYEKDIHLLVEAYELIIEPMQIEVRASSEIGAYYAMTTLVQLIQINQGKLTCCKIKDKPQLKIRGFSDDISRGQISTQENFKHIIKRLSFYKYNIYMPYIEDTIKFDCIPESGKYSDPMTKEEWQELIDYANKHYIKIIPIINILGHWDKNATLANFEEYMLKENGEITPDLDATSPKVKQLVVELLKEATQLFGGQGYMHVGGDEVGAYTRSFGKKIAGDIYNAHYQLAYKELKKYNLSMLLYSDMYTPIWGDYQIGIERIDEMPEDIHFVYWDYGYREHYPNIDELIKRQKKIVVSPGTYTWNRCLPHVEIAFLNTKCIARQAPSYYEGLIMSAWCDGGMTLREENWFGILAGAIFAWAPQCEMSFEDYTKTFYEIYYGIENLDLAKFQQLFSYDKGYGLKDLNEIQDIGCRLHREFWKDARLPGDEVLQAGLGGVQERLEEALGYFQQLNPLRNQMTYEVFLFDIKKLIANIKKVKLIKSVAYGSREEAMADIPKIQSLAEEIERLRRENKRLWFDSNRQSEWEYAECHYLDLIDSLKALARYCKVAKRLRKEKLL